MGKTVEFSPSKLHMLFLYWWEQCSSSAGVCAAQYTRHWASEATEHEEQGSSELRYATSINYTWDFKVSAPKMKKELIQALMGMFLSS